jgi:hypothetical protein
LILRSGLVPVLVGNTTPLWFKEEVAEPLWMVRLEPSGEGVGVPPTRISMHKVIPHAGR